jgi:D-alanine-D-alanine ligase-like ATP-grasp enzyme
MNLLIVTSEHPLADAISIARLQEQLDFLGRIGVSSTLLIDPDQITLEKEILTWQYDIAFATTMHSFAQPFSETDTPRRFNVIRCLQHYDQPHIGCPLFTQLLVDDKCLVSHIVQDCLPGIVLTRAVFEHESKSFIIDLIKNAPFPVIIKPNTLLASLGISEASINFSPESAFDIVCGLFDRFPQLTEIRLEKFFESFREYAVSVVGNPPNQLFSFTEVCSRQKKIRIFDEHQKRLPSQERKFTYSVVEDKKLRMILEFRAQQYFNQLGMKDYAKFDFVADDTPFLIDANSLPLTGSAFSWEWQKRFNFEPQQTLAMLLLVRCMRLQARNRHKIIGALSSCLPKPVSAVLKGELSFSAQDLSYLYR